MKSNIIKAAISIVKSTGKYPSQLELEKAGISRAMIRRTFGNYSLLNDHLAEICSEIFDLEKSKVNTKLPNKKRFVITTAVTESKVHKGFLAAINTYCKKENAGLIVMPTKSTGNSRWVLDSVLKDECFVMDDVQLNSNLKLLGLITAAKTTDPTTGLPRIGQRNGTFITASPKQRLKFVATGVNKLPHALMSTGAITVPSYDTASILNKKSEYIAENDHIMGAIIVELDNNDAFHFRQIQADSSGNFVDLGILYGKLGTKPMAPSAFILGDWHSGDSDPIVVACIEKLTKKLKPKKWIIHDIFDGKSVNPHTEGKEIVRAKLANDNKLNLAEELNLLKADIDYMSSMVSEVIIVRSNHDDFLDRYLNKAEYVGDNKNHRLALELAIHLLDDKNPLEEYVGKIKNVKWLKLDESYKIAGIECGMHGHLGGNGARGSITQMETAYGKVMFGHTHTPGILRDAWNVGTTTYLDLGYNKGASSWLQCSGIIYPNGQRQLINFIEGQFTTKNL